MGKSMSKNPTVSHPAMNPGVRDPRVVLPRDQVQDANNPYIPEAHLEDGSVCVGCGAVYHNQHWNLDERRRDLLVNTGAAKEVQCPACKIVQERNPQGIVTLSGDYWGQHRDEILNLVRNEESRASQVNPLERIIDIRDESDCLVIETTNVKLAQRIGRRVHSAHKGEVQYRWPDGDHLVRVYWERNLNGAA